MMDWNLCPGSRQVFIDFNEGPHDDPAGAWIGTQRTQTIKIGDDSDEHKSNGGVVIFDRKGQNPKANDKSESLHRRSSSNWPSQFELASWLEQLNRIAVGIFQLDLLATRANLHLIPKVHTSLFQRFNSSGQVFDLQNYSIPSTRDLRQRRWYEMRKCSDDQ